MFLIYKSAFVFTQLPLCSKNRSFSGIQPSQLNGFYYCPSLRIRCNFIRCIENSMEFFEILNESSYIPVFIRFGDSKTPRNSINPTSHPTEMADCKINGISWMSMKLSIGMGDDDNVSGNSVQCVLVTISITLDCNLPYMWYEMADM